MEGIGRGLYPAMDLRRLMMMMIYLFEAPHEGISIGGCSNSVHDPSIDLKENFIIESKVIKKKCFIRAVIISVIGSVTFVLFRTS